MKLFLNLLLVIFLSETSVAQIKRSIDLLLAKEVDPFNGTILIYQNGKKIYSKTKGYSNFADKKKLKKDHPFVVGSISKQFTAVMVLQEYEKGHIDLFAPIRNYLPDLKMPWADIVTVHQLLTHTHGIIGLAMETEFIPGTQFSYSQLGYELLGQIVEKTSGKSLAAYASELFKSCGMKNSYHPEFLSYIAFDKGYTKDTNGILQVENKTFQNYPAAGSFISTAHDLLLWNTALFGNKILKPSTLSLMISKKDVAIRDHPLFRKTYYGYGITNEEDESIIRLGQTGFAPGFASMDFYFPESKTSIIILENVVYSEKLILNFYYHLTIFQIVKAI